MSRSSIVVAALLILGIGGWLASGMLRQEEAPTAPQAARPEPPLVEVTRSEASPVTRNIVAQGDVRAFRNAAARAETAGQVSELLVEVGERVELGEPIARLTLEGRGSRLREARAVLEQRQADHEAAAELLQRGFTSEARVRELGAQLESARSTVEALEEEIGNTTVAAPFAGIVNSLEVVEGEYVDVNSEVATLVDNSPLRIDVRVNQQDFSRLPRDGTARVAFATGETEGGRICFVSATADPSTRTFRVEVRTPNPDNSVPSGISAEVSIPTGSVAAHFVSPAVLALDTDGTPGVKTVSDAGEVAFQPVRVVRAETDGIWISGLPETARIITIGQGFVQAGDPVRVAPADGESAVGSAGQPSPGPQDLTYPPSSICDREPPLTSDDTVADLAAASGATRADGDTAMPAGIEASGETVARVQQALERLGYDAGPSDGVIRGQTREAIRSWREENGLSASGRLDAATAQRILDQAGLAPSEDTPQ